MTKAPHVFFVGNQPRFETAIVDHGGGSKTRVVLLPRFSDNGEVILVNPATLEVKAVRMDCLWNE